MYIGTRPAIRMCCRRGSGSWILMYTCRAGRGKGRPTLLQSTCVQSSRTGLRSPVGSQHVQQLCRLCSAEYSTAIWQTVAMLSSSLMSMGTERRRGPLTVGRNGVLPHPCPCPCPCPCSPRARAKYLAYFSHVHTRCPRRERVRPECFRWLVHIIRFDAATGGWGRRMAEK